MLTSSARNTLMFNRRLAPAQSNDRIAPRFEMTKSNVCILIRTVLWKSRQILIVRNM